MIDLHLAKQQLNQIGYANPEEKLELLERAHSLFRRAYLWGQLNRVSARLTGRSYQMGDLAAVAPPQKVRNRHYVGLQVVPVEQIRGSEGRTLDFDNKFNPLQQHTEQRWLSLATVWLRGESLPPVQLIRAGSVYFVRDGHHRVSVARALGQTYIDAEVVVWEVEPPRPVPAPFACVPSCAG